MSATPEISAEAEILVPFHDCDPAGVVWHGHYAKYLEVARCALLESIGYNYDAMAASGYVWPLIDYRLRFVAPARFKQRLRVRASLREWQYRLKLAYEIRDCDSNARLSRGETVQVAVDLHSGEMQLASPDILRACLGL